jgi:hypothetical protein
VVDEAVVDEEELVDEETGGEVVGEEIVYTLRRLGPPQNSPLFPLQSIEQSLAGVGAPPLEKALAQSVRGKANKTNTGY